MKRKPGKCCLVKRMKTIEISENNKIGSCVHLMIHLLIDRSRYTYSFDSLLTYIIQLFHAYLWYSQNYYPRYCG